MKAFAVCTPENPSCAFVVKVKDDSDYEKAKELTLKGYYKWHDLDNHPEMECVDYADPISELLDKAGIEHEFDDYWDEDLEEPTEDKWWHWASNYEDISPKTEYLDIEIIW